MKIPILLPNNVAAQPNFNGKFLEPYMVSNWDYTAPHSIIKCVENNPKNFSEEEKLLISELISSGDTNNRIIAFHIIDSKPEINDIGRIS